MHDAIARVHGHDFALHDVAFRVARCDFEQRVPTADVRPAEIAGHHRGAVGLFHHRIVDRFLRRARETRRVEAQETEVVGRVLHCGFDCVRHLRLQPRQFGEQHVGAEQEIARVPQIAFAHIFLGVGRVRLLDETPDAVDRAAVDRLARQDIAVAGLRLARLDAEGDDVAGLGGGAAGQAGGAELRHVQDDVVGGQRQHHRLRVAPTGDRRRRRDRRA